MNIEFLEEELVEFINKFFPNLNWDGHDSSAAADLIIDNYGCIDYDLMYSIGEAMQALKNKEFTLTIRPKENKLIIYYID